MLHGTWEFQGEWLTPDPSFRVLGPCLAMCIVLGKECSVHEYQEDEKGRMVGSPWSNIYPLRDKNSSMD